VVSDEAMRLAVIDKLFQIQAAELRGISLPKLSNMLRGQFRGISEKKMINCQTRLGRNHR